MPPTEIDIVRLHDAAARRARRDQPGESSRDQPTAWFELTLGLLTSTVLHFMLLVGLAVVYYITPEARRPPELVMTIDQDGSVESDELQFDALPVEPVIAQPSPVEVATPTIAAPQPAAAADMPLENAPQVATRVTAPKPPPQPTNRPSKVQPSGGLAGAAVVDRDLSGALVGRSSPQKQSLLEAAGGTEGSERAVQLALAWLAEHQQADGSWRLNHQTGPCAGRCGDPGLKAPAKNGATALALLPFLGAGHTHREGAYADVVKLGIEYLVSRLPENVSDGGWMDEGQMYSHGLATIAICEALAMSGDRGLFPAAQRAVDFIVAAQHMQQGGWRYRPGEPGDTTVTGWQLMALKTASMSYVHVPPETIRRAWSFIDAVELPSRFQYAYQAGERYDPSARRAKSDRHRATSAVGLLCRMYLGWDREHPALVDGIGWLGKKGPSRGPEPDLYYNYYATQVLRHFGGPGWDPWNTALRDFLIKTQHRRGHAMGSWFFPGEHNQAGGRLYCTSMATMILEVYYRHMPLYSPQATSNTFRL